MSISPELEAAIAKLAKLTKLTVERGWDPGKVLQGLINLHEALAKLTPEQRCAVREALKEARDAR